MKAYTDIDQSKKLAEILPLESADMCYLPTHIGDEHHFIAFLSPYSMCTKMADVSIEYCTPCWSLAALLDILPNNEYITTYVSRGSWQIEPINYLPNTWWCEYENNETMDEFNISSDNSVDACVEMIFKLKEKNLL